MNSSTFRVSLSGIGQLGKQAQVVLFALMAYLCAPLVHAAIPMHALDAGLVVFCGVAVLNVFGMGHFPQIINAVIAASVVDMVKKLAWVRAVHVEPCKPMGFVLNAINFNQDVPVIKPSSKVAAIGFPVARVGKPVKPSRFWIVMKKLAQTLRGKIGLSHDALLLLIGQRPASADNASGLRYFKGVV